MSRKKDTGPADPAVAIEQPRRGGSYVRAKDGSLARREFTTAASIGAASADAPAADAPVETTIVAPSVVPVAASGQEG